MEIIMAGKGREKEYTNSFTSMKGKYKEFQLFSLN